MMDSGDVGATEIKIRKITNEKSHVENRENDVDVISKKLDVNMRSVDDIKDKHCNKKLKKVKEDDSKATKAEKKTVEENLDEFYGRGKQYWDGVEASVNGVLGGLGHVSGIDIAESTKFLKQFIKSPVANTKSNYALDCGAGIGRVTKKLLLPLFTSVDLVEVSKHFLDAAPAFIGDGASRVGEYICCGLQEFIPKTGKYDVIWCQWVLGHLTDNDLVDFFKRCKAGLAPNGLICFKENISSSSELDQKDSSYTRSRQHFLDLVALAGLHVVKETRQKTFPSDLYQVQMFAVS